MKIQFYNNRSGINIINKKLDIIGEEIEFTLKEDTNIINPILKLGGYTGGNYCYIPDFNRYYFIDNYNLNSAGVYELFLSVDVLMSYKEDLVAGKLLIKSDESGIKYLDNKEEYNNLYTTDQFLVLRANL